MLLIITIAFIISLRLLDQNYQELEKAGQLRARILEVNLNFEFSETIALHYTAQSKGQEFADFITRLYYGFMTVTLILGITILFPTNAFANTKLLLSTIPYFLGLIIAVAIGFYYLRNISLSLKISEGRLDSKDVKDWILDKVTCEKGESVKITVTNLGINPCVFKKDETAFVIKNDDGYRHEEKPKEDIIVGGGFGNHSWLWDTSNKDVKPNRVYQIIPKKRMDLENNPQPLKRTIVVAEKSDT